MRFSDFINKNTANQMNNHSVKHPIQHAKKKAFKHEKVEHSKLAKIRINNMLTVNEAARLCNVRPSVIKRWETTGTNQNDTIYSIKKYARLLHMPFKKLNKMLNK